jgi:uncharacterized protein (TIGR03437 family)
MYMNLRPHFQLLSPGHRRCLIIAACLILAGSAIFVSHNSSAQSPAVVAETRVSISTVAGGGFGSNVAARQAPMVQPTAAVLDPQGRGFYIVDESNTATLIRFANTSSNTVTLGGVIIHSNHINLIAGGGYQSTDGSPALDFDLEQITGIAIKPSGDVLYICSPAFSAIQAVNLSTQPVTVFGKSLSPGTINLIASINFDEFRALTVHPATGDLYFITGRIVYKLDGAGAVTPFAGGGNPSPGEGDGGAATRARLTAPMGLAFDTNNNLLIAEGGDVRLRPGSVRRVHSNGIISTLVYGLNFPTGITSAPNGDAVVALGNAQQVIRITPAGRVTMVAGSATPARCDITINPTCGDGGPANQAFLNVPDSRANVTLTLAADSRGIYLPDFGYNRVRFINTSGGLMTLLGKNIHSQNIDTIVGNGLASPFDRIAATSAELKLPAGVTADALGNLFISDTGHNRLRFVNRTSAPVTLFPGTLSEMTVQPGHIVTLNKDVGGSPVDNRITTALFAAPQGLAAMPSGLLIVDSQAGALVRDAPESINGRRSGVIRFLNTSIDDVVFFPNSSEARVTISPGQIKDIAGVRPPIDPQGIGDGLAANRVAFFSTDVAIDIQGNVIIADQGNNRIRRIDGSTGIVSTLYGDGKAATLNGPAGIAYDRAGRLLIADTLNNRILREGRQGSAPGSGVTVIADNGTNAINRPRDLTVDGDGKIFITNSFTHQIYDLDAPGDRLGVTSVVAGTGGAGFSGDHGPGPRGRINLPNPSNIDLQVTANITSLPNGDLIFADTNNNRIRMLRRVSETATVSSASAASFNSSELAIESIAVSFGERLATGTENADTLPLPTLLAGTTVQITDSIGIERFAPIFFVGPTQINYQIPPGTLNGSATITVTSGDGTVSTGTLDITPVVPGLFAANANGQGVAAAVVLRERGNGAQQFEQMTRLDAGGFVPIPIDLGAPSDQVFLVLFGTGFRLRNITSPVSATIGGEASPVLYAGEALGLVGLDQANIRIPRILAGRGLVNVTMTVDGKTTNPVTVQIK